MRVLVVDDHKNTRESLVLGLALYGHEADADGSAVEAISRLEQQSYDCVVSDVRMDGVTGLDLVAAARERDAGLGLILMTAHDVSEDERRRIDALGVRLVIKPVTAQQLAILCSQHDPVATAKGTRS
ncbi:MAG: response regulator [Vicinamibacterales bacterium]